MPLRDDLYSQVAQILHGNWTSRNGQVVPESDALGLGKDAVTLSGAVLYADLRGSTALVDNYLPSFAAEVYKAYLHCAAKVIRSQQGEITSYDGDRIMAVFIGPAKEARAARAGLMLNWVVNHVIDPSLQVKYAGLAYRCQQTVGIDVSDLFIARTGIRGANDLVWVGRAANHAAKLSAMDASYPTWISGEIYNALPANLTHVGLAPAWEPRDWTAMGNRRIYRSDHWVVVT